MTSVFGTINFEVIQNYLIEQKKIDTKFLTDDLGFRLNPPDNFWIKEWEDLIEEVKIIIKDCLFSGFHCTRLVESEIDDIKSKGIKPLCPDFTKKRVKKILHGNLISEKTAKEIIDKNESSASNRIGQICFFHYLSTLKKEGSIIISGS